MNQLLINMEGDGWLAANWQVLVAVLLLVVIFVCFYIRWKVDAAEAMDDIIYLDKGAPTTSQVTDTISKYRQDFISRLTAELMYEMCIPTEGFNADNLLLSLSPEDTTIYTLLYGAQEINAEIVWRKKKIFLTYHAELKDGRSFYKDFAFRFKGNWIDFPALEVYITNCQNEVISLSGVADEKDSGSEGSK